MKKVLYSLIAASLFAVSCGSDDSPVLTHEIGSWDLDSYIFINFPAGFEDNENLALAIDRISFGGSPYEDYNLTLNADGTYTREIGITGPDLEDAGTWELDGDDLVLDSEEVGEIDWVVEKNEDDDLWLSFESQNNFIPDIYFDTVTQTYLDYLQTLTPAQIDSVDNALSELISFDLVFVFERSK